MFTILLGSKKTMFAFLVTALFWLPSLSTTAKFLKPESVLSEKPDQVTLGLIMVNIKQESRSTTTADLFKENIKEVIKQQTTTADLFKERLDALVLSLVHHSTVPILLVVVTDSGTLSGELYLWSL